MDNFTKALIENIVSGSVFIARVAAFVKRHVTQAGRKSIETRATSETEMPFSSDRSPSTSVGAILDIESKAKRPRRNRHGRKDRRYHDSSMKSREKRTKGQGLSSTSSLADGSQKVRNYMSSG